MLINRKIFFDLVRRSVFGGRLTQEQVEGMEKILTYWEDRTEERPRDLRHLGYMLATVYWETSHTMQPIKERGSLTYLKGKKYYPWFGRGLVQLTWEENYKVMNTVLRKMGLKCDLIKDPDQALEWEYALPILFEGMTLGITSRGDFTGKALEHYFNGTQDDPIGARHIINGTDRAIEISQIHDRFCSALLAGVSHRAS